MSSALKVRPALELEDPALEQRFEELFEQWRPWPGGAEQLRSIVRAMRGKSIMIARVEHDPTALKAVLPIPNIEPPIEHYAIFQGCLGKVMQARWPDIQGLAPLIGSPNDEFTLNRANAMLMERELAREARGRGELWKVVACAFGLDWKFIL